jgi:hypothetical protein
MQGGPSHVDSFDPKPALEKYDGKKVAIRNDRAMQVREEPMMKALWPFKRHGQSGIPVSSLFPHIGSCADDLCVVRSLHTEGVAHGPSTLFMHTGATNLIRPSVGAWVTYGLGTPNENLPGFVTISPPMANGGPRNYSNAFLPTVFQGTRLGRVGTSVKDSKFQHITNERMSADEHRRQFDYLQALNREQLKYAGGTSGGTSGGASGSGGDELEATIDSFELAYRMQMHAPQVTDLSDEPAHVLESYGIGNGKPTDEFGRQCLLARRFAERDVRFIQVNYSDNGSNPRWDQHSNMPAHENHALATDQPVAALLKDLKRRGLLEDTLVWWGGEFGRTPYSQGKNGRDHNPSGFTILLAGGGVKAGHIHGETDEWGHSAVRDKVHMHDLHATVLHLLGLDHERLTYRYAGRDFRLTDVYGRVVHELFA